MKSTYRAIIPELHRRALTPLGRNVEHDPLSRGYAMSLPVGITDPTQLPSVEWRRFIPPLTQVQRSCTGQAMVGVLATGPFCNNRDYAVGLNEALAVKIYSEATALDDFPGTYPPDDTGSSGNAACKAARKFGLISSWQWTFSVLTFLAALQKQPVMVGVPWYESMYTPDQYGVVKAEGDIAGGHEFEISGWIRESQMLICWNSWGLEYGLNGKFHIPLEVWRELHDQQADVIIPQRLAALNKH